MSMPPTATRAEIEQARESMGLDRPLPEQYAIWLNQVAHGDLGISSHLRRPVGELLADTLPATIELAVAAMVVAGTLGMVGGLTLFALRGRLLEPAAETATTLMMSVPEFLWALLFIFVFGVALQVLPFTGRLDPGIARPDITGFLLLDCLIKGDFGALPQRADPPHPAGFRPRHRRFSADHPRAAGVPDRDLL